jgi:hypothetical protein
MVSPASYLLSAALVAAVGLSVGFSAFRVRRHLLPGWDGAPARLVEAVLAVALLLWLCELLGLLGLLYASTLVLESLLLAAGVVAWTADAASAGGAGEGGIRTAESASSSLPRDRTRGRDALSLVAIAVVFVVFAHWGISAKEALDHGISNFDSLWYHMPFAAHIAQSHSVTGTLHTDTVYTNWFYPQNSELVHAAGILLARRDTLSLFVNFAWLGLAFLAAWCVGRPYGRAPLTTIAAAVVLASPTLVELEPGQAKNDAMALALLLAAAAILLNARGKRGRRSGEEGGPGPGWPLAAAGLAAGLAAGTRDTALPMAGALSVAAIALAPAGRRAATAAWWLLPALVGGGFWYLRNLIVAGNPIPQLKGLGPLLLPHPAQVQSGRPDFAVAHYLFDGAIWREWFVPALEFTLGDLWPLFFAGAVAGALLALLRGSGRVLRGLGAVALFGLLAYLATPFSAGGPEGSPVEFLFNVRFALPALLLGLLLLALARELETRAARWGLAATLIAILVLTDDPAALLHDPGLLFGLLLALLAVGLPALLLLGWRRGGSDRAVAAGFAGLLLLLAAIGYPLQRHYLHGRYGADSGLPGYGLSSAYAWGRGVSGARIGLAGTIAGIQSYGFYGADLSNRVAYLGRRGPHGAFNPIPGCAAFRAAVNGAHLDYLVTAPFLDFIVRGRLDPSPEARWLAGSGAVAPIVREGEVTVWRVRGRLDPAACGAENAPLREVPRQPYS